MKEQNWPPPYPNCPGPGPHDGGPLYLRSNAAVKTPVGREGTKNYMYACAACWAKTTRSHGSAVIWPPARDEAAIDR